MSELPLNYPPPVPGRENLLPGRMDRYVREIWEVEHAPAPFGPPAPKKLSRQGRRPLPPAPFDPEPWRVHEDGTRRSTLELWELARIHGENKDKPSDLRQACEQVLGKIKWQGSDGYCTCPGEQEHPKCLVRVGDDGIPFAYCVHERCREDVANANAELRERCLSSGLVAKRAPTPEDRRRKAEAKRLRHLEWIAKSQLLPKLIRQPVALEKWTELSPYPILQLTHQQQSRAFISSLYPRYVPGQVEEFGNPHLVWLGDPWETDSETYHTHTNADRFRLVQDWMVAPDVELQGQQIGTCTFTQGPCRCKKAVNKRIFITLESDNLAPEQFGAVVNFMRKYSTLRSITHTGGKSIHCNFDFEHEVFYNRELEAILKGLGCDERMLNTSLTTRLPGQKRKNEQGWYTGKWQELLYLDPKFEVIL